jgi:hypothetical protein
MSVSGPGASGTRDGANVSFSFTSQEGTYTATDTDNGGVTNVNVVTNNGNCSLQ